MEIIKTIPLATPGIKGLGMRITFLVKGYSFFFQKSIEAHIV
jgi:hypothetical protein